MTPIGDHKKEEKRQPPPPPPRQPKQDQKGMFPTLSPLSSSPPSSLLSSRRRWIQRTLCYYSVAAAASSSSFLAHAAEEKKKDDQGDTSFASISERASAISKAIVDAEEREVKSRSISSVILDDSRSVYDFTLPLDGIDIPFGEWIGQEFLDDRSTPSEKGGDDGTTSSRRRGTKVKAILVVNIKLDDPLARSNIPEFISLATKYGRNGAFHVVACPTDQGYFEPDTSTVIRLKLEAEYGYGINPVTHTSDKVNLLGTGAHPLWRYLQNTCRTPEGLGKIQANYEKFLIDGRTGKPLRRYPRKYNPSDLVDDIESVLSDRPMPPAGGNFLEEWRIASVDAERDTYRFQKGLNVFDQ